MDASTPSPTEPLDAAMKDERVRHHRGKLVSAVGASGGGAVLAIVLLWGHVAQSILLGWSICLALALCLRIFTSGRYDQDPHVATHGQLWLNRFRRDYFIHGLAWALLAGLLTWVEPTQFHLLLLILIAVAASSFFTTVFDVAAALSFVVPITVALVVSIPLRAGESYVPLLVALLMFLVTTYASALRAQRIVQESVRLRLAEAQRDAHLHHTLNAFPGYIARVNEQLMYTYVNHRMAERYGTSAAQMVGRFAGDFLESAQVLRLQTFMQEALAGTPVSYEQQHTGSASEGFTEQITLSASTDPSSGKPICYSFGVDITERKKAEAKIQELAFYDTLTGLPNRRLLMDRLHHAMVNGQRNGTHCAVLFIDLDRFKTLNDTLGHDKGDQLLAQTAERIAACLRDGDTVARLGGDEFVVLLENLSGPAHGIAVQAEIVARKVLADLRRVYLLGDTEYLNTASVGVRLFQGSETPADEILMHADLAMYKSKDAGRDTFHFFDPAMQSVILKRVALETDLRKGIQDNQLVLHYQPQLTRDGKLAGCEALVRWQHLLRGMVPPVEFIQIAEDSGLILPLGQWVLATACAQLARWSQHRSMAHLVVAVNVSARQFLQDNFVDDVVQALAHSGAKPTQLKLELTESVLIANLEDVIRKMQQLKTIGVGFALDDFGTGYSSLSYLSRLPLDQVKIDRSFVNNIENDSNSVLICAATISLAHSLKLQVVAEGVETEAQRYFLSTVHRCDLIQGYLLSRPLPVDAFEAFANGSASSVLA